MTEEILKEISGKLSKKGDINLTFNSTLSDFTTPIYPPLQLDEGRWVVGLLSLDTYYSFTNITNTKNRFCPLLQCMQCTMHKMGSSYEHVRPSVRLSVCRVLYCGQTVWATITKFGQWDDLDPKSSLTENDVTSYFRSAAILHFVKYNRTATKRMTMNIHTTHRPTLCYSAKRDTAISRSYVAKLLGFQPFTLAAQVQFPA